MAMSDGAPWIKHGAPPAEVYERYLVPAIFAPWSDLLLDAATPRPGERVLDVACGTGIVARRAAQRAGPGGRVAGLDLNPAMLAAARTAAADSSVTMSIEWHEASAVLMPFPNARFALVLCQHGLQFFADKLAGLREMRRVLVPGGRLALMVMGAVEEAPGYAALSQALGHHISPDAAALPPFALSDPDELRCLLAEAGFAGIEVAPAEVTLRFTSAAEFVGLLAAGAPSMLGALAGVAGDARRNVLSDMTEALRPYQDGDSVAFPQWSNVATARA
jgi:ubiquinone/menaquinone biosynthesis C-methylase UbiE